MLNPRAGIRNLIALISAAGFAPTRSGAEAVVPVGGPRPEAAAVQMALQGAAADVSGQPLKYTGVNISGGEFGSRKPGTAARFGVDYTYPSPAELNYFASKGANIIRFPFRWEDLQPSLYQPLEPAALDRISTVVAEATKRGILVVLDPHNYARYYDKMVGGPEVPATAFADLWGRLALQFRANRQVWFGLVNEPYGISAEQWTGVANQAIAAIRKAGARNVILVPGTSWTGAHSWVSSGNAQAMLKLADPGHNYLFDVHQYLDADSSGTKPSIVSPTIGSERLREFTLWCRQHHRRGFLGEFGAAASDPASSHAIEDMLAYVEANRDVWYGWTWWAAGAWWGDYMFSLEPKSGTDSPILAWLKPHLQHPSALRN